MAALFPHHQLSVSFLVVLVLAPSSACLDQTPSQLHEYNMSISRQEYRVLQLKVQSLVNTLRLLLLVCTKFSEISELPIFRNYFTLSYKIVYLDSKN